MADDENASQPPDTEAPAGIIEDDAAAPEESEPTPETTTEDPVPGDQTTPDTLPEGEPDATTPEEEISPATEPPPAEEASVSDIEESKTEKEVEPPAQDVEGPSPAPEKPEPVPHDAVSKIKTEPPAKERKESKENGIKQLFDSKGSLMETESYVKEKLKERKEKKEEVAKMIRELQAKVKEYKEKEHPTEDEIANLKKYHTLFLEAMSEYDEMTRNVEKLMGMADTPTSQLDMTISGPPITTPAKPAEPPVSPKPLRPSQVDTFPEDKLPKLIVCGTDMGDSIPRIIVCEPLRKADMEPFHKSSPQTEGVTGDMMRKLRENLEIKQQLAAENAELAQIRHQLQEELFDKQEMLNTMKQKLITLEGEKHRILTENSELQNRLLLTQKPGDPVMCKRELYLKLRGRSPETGSPGSCLVENTQDLEQELERMGDEVKNISCELETIQKGKLSLGYSTGSRSPVCKRMLPQKCTQTDEDKEKDVFFESDKDPRLLDLKEQYQRLHNDFKNKVTEVAALRVELDKTKEELDGIIIVHHELEAMHQQELDQNNHLMSEMKKVQSYKEQITDLEQQANMAKQMFKSSQEETEEMRALIEDQATQLDEYRNKYMKTLQIAEELKKENEFKERECADQIAVEIQRVKLEMQEQLEELSPIKDLLKITQQKLKETEQMHTIALESIADMSQNLEDARTEIAAMKTNIAEAASSEDIQANLQHSLEVAEKKMTDLDSENDHLKEIISQLESLQVVQNQKLEEKSHEVLQLVTQLETLREESARQVARVKERSEMVRKCLQAQIAEMEREVAQCRAATAFANRERDEIRSKLQLEVCLLSENFRESQNRIVQLQQHVNYLSAAHPTSFIDLCQ